MKTLASIAAVLLLALSGDGDAADALVYWRESWTEPRPVVVHFLRLDLRSAELELFVMVADDPDGSGPAEAQLTLPMELAAGHDALAAVNANAFRALPDAEGNRNTHWFEGQPVDIVGRAVEDGEHWSGGEAPRNTFWMGKRGKCHFSEPRRPEKVAHAVSDWSQLLLADGKVVVKEDGICHPRTVIGMDRRGRFLLIAVIDGRQPGYSEGISLHEAARLMKDRGCHNSLNLDGGGSSIMLLQEAGKLEIINRPSAGPRPIPVMLGVRLRR